MCGRSRVNVKVAQDSTFTYTRDPPYITSILFTRVKFKLNFLPYILLMSIFLLFLTNTNTLPLK